MNDSGQSFADLFGKTEVVESRMEPGQKVAARVVRLGKDWIFLDLGGKSEGSIAKNEFVDDEGQLTVQEGDSVEVYFLSVKNNEKLFTTRVSGAAAQGHLEEAFHSGIPVEGTVDKEVKGGFEVKIGGKIRAFCPYSLLDMRRVTNAEDYIGQTYSFRVTKFSENGRNIVVSRRAILEAARGELKDKLQESLKVGDTVNGVITNIRDFGAFVDIGGIEGLIPVSEIAWGHVEDINERIAEGQEVSVTVLKLDWENDRYSFSLKETMPDPWEDINRKFPEGSTHTGKVARLTDFGAFVTLAPGIDGLAHISKLGAGRRINHPREVVQMGDVIEVRIDSVDLDKKRLSLSVPAPDKAEEKKPASAKNAPQDEGDYKQYVAKAAKDKSLGTFGDLFKAKFDKKG
ncbi:MAG TPA: 30S ribosomal protein S1 [Deltaproteobacteria bacterium]|nr:30S ribosomal protein S1 [Deltaproteobacteria bacterium]